MVKKLINKIKKKNDVSCETSFRLNKLLVVFGILGLVLTQVQTYHAKTDIGIGGSSYLIIDEETGVVQAARNEFKQYGIASLTKLMTAYVVLDEIKAGNISLKDEIKVSERAAGLRKYDPSLSGVDLTIGEKMTVDLALKLALVYSDNGISIALAEHIAGTEQKFVKKMNDKAEELELFETKYYNASGLTMYDYGPYQIANTFEEDYNVSTAVEQAKLVKAIIKEHPEMIEYTSEPHVTFHGTEYDNYNSMLQGLEYEYPGVIGMKTGTSDEAGACFISLFEKLEKKYVTIILGADSVGQRFSETQLMLMWISNTNFTEVITENMEFKVDINGDRGFSKNLKPVSGVVIPSEDNGNFEVSEFVGNKKYFSDNVLVEKIPKGEIIGYLNLTNAEKEVVYETIYQENKLYVPVYSDKAIRPANLMWKIIDATRELFADVSKNI